MMIPRPGQLKWTALSQRVARQVRHLRREERGSQLVELAIAVPLLLALLTGMASFGIVFLDYFTLTNGADAGARTLALYRGSSTSASNPWDPCAAAVTGLYNAAPRLSQSSLSITVVITPYQGTATTYPPGQSASCASQSLGSQGGGTVQVSASYPVQTPIYGWKTTSISLTASTTERIQ